MVIGRYCTAFTDTGRIFYIYVYFFLFYPSRFPTAAASTAAAVTAEAATAMRNEESHVRGRVNRKKNNSVSESLSGGIYVSFFLLRSHFSLVISRLPRFRFTLLSRRLERREMEIGGEEAHRREEGREEKTREGSYAATDFF